MKYFKSTVDYYNDRANIYDETAGYKNIYSEKIREEIKNRFQELLKNYDVIEIACGTGYWTKVISAVAKHVTAIDINDKMTEWNAKKFSDKYAIKFDGGMYTLAASAFNKFADLHNLKIKEIVKNLPGKDMNYK